MSPKQGFISDHRAPWRSSELKFSAMLIHSASIAYENATSLFAERKAMTMVQDGQFRNEHLEEEK